MKNYKFSNNNHENEHLNLIAEGALDSGKAINIISIPLSGKSSIADYMIVASGTSARHVSALADQLNKKIKKAGYRIFSIQGQSDSNWVLVDAGDVIIHLFRPEVREFYNLEKMWLAPQETIKI